MHLQNASKEILRQLIQLAHQLNTRQYAQPLPILSGNSIGKHMRHLIEFYDLLLKSYPSGELNYDHRKHDLSLEECPNLAVQKINLLIDLLTTLDLNQPLYLETCLSVETNEKVRIPSSYSRELLYNIEHAIHHMAMIRMAIRDAFPHVVLPDDFGVAYGTVKYQTQS